MIGCASTVKIDPATKSSLNDGIAINPTLQLAQKPYYHGPEHLWGAALGGVAGAIIASNGVDEPTKIQNYLAAQKIDVASLVLDEFKRQANEHADSGSEVKRLDSTDILPLF